ncbi:inositol-pentakisphosphate 2-kinase [Cokeromyces recurvatus]|uniref:inositol-pentakisphosphate 2-kinase n=1 Tax=Cokeromyces recurvatus TaxID=90255 RepID=UPI00221F7529|nr:inositol-pentakisphosphate 2-kinase [Cokeromyces recurvatus]KAI7905572.1 inositol-pentakisphosphate 2-kinase [Cokeromyces recurvatus]
MTYASLQKAENASYWEYVGEGNQNLVVRYIGNDSIFKRKALRILKCDESEIKIPTKHDILFKQQFIERIIRKLVGHEYILLMQPVNTSSSFLSQLAQNIEHVRPISRRKKKIITTTCISFLMDDLTQLWPNSPSLTLELKPKWGFKPSSPFANEIKKKYCRFCMHSHLRGDLLKEYCPLDLYSGDPERIKKALTILFMNIPQTKTLRITFAHKINEQPSKVKDVYHLLSNDDGLIQEILEHILLEDPILRKLKRLQSTLDELDIEGILPLYNQLDTSLETQDIEIWEDVLANYEAEQNDLSVNNRKQKIYEYLLSMTFKDCSIMINIAPAAVANSHKSIKCRHLLFQYDLKVVDTDLKNIDKIPYWYTLDQSIVHNTLNTKFKKQECLS